VRCVCVPFTIAHAAAVLPFLSRRVVRRRWFDATCLVTGAMAPDFEYFLHARMESNVSHTLMGLVVFDVPVALAIAVVFHALVRVPLASALPSSLYARFTGFLTTSWRPRAHVALISAFIGAVTHLVWDACTHRMGWIVRTFPLLERDVLVDGLPAYRLLQHVSTVIGLALIAFAIARSRRHVVAQVQSRRARVVFIAVPLAFGVVGAIARIVVEEGARVYGHAIAAFIAGALIGICAASLLVRRIGQPAAAPSS
jgi:hypothetical protein